MDESNEDLSDCLYWHFIGEDAEKYKFAIKDEVSEIRKEIVRFAVEQLDLDKKDEWLYEASSDLVPLVKSAKALLKQSVND